MFYFHTLISKVYDRVWSLSSSLVDYYIGDVNQHLGYDDVQLLTFDSPQPPPQSPPQLPPQLPQPIQEINILPTIEENINSLETNKTNSVHFKNNHEEICSMFVKYLRRNGYYFIEKENFISGLEHFSRDYGYTKVLKLKMSTIDYYYSTINNLNTDMENLYL